MRIVFTLLAFAGVCDARRLRFFAGGGDMMPMPPIDGFAPIDGEEFCAHTI